MAICRSLDWEGVAGQEVSREVGGGLGLARPVRRRSVYEGGGGVGKTMGSEAGEKGGNVIGIRNGESVVKTVV